mgnify:CR=1 FL=1
MSQEKLLYLSSDPRRDFVDKIVDWAFLQSVRRIETRGSERNIPPKGPFVLGFAPHSGWLEVFVIDHYLRKARDSGQGAVWITKKENAQDIPHWVRGERRLLFLDRGEPTPYVFRSARRIMERGGIVGSAFEGTRYGNPDDPEDLLTLGRFKPGLVHIARKAGVPIIPVVVLGVEKVIPSPEKVKSKSQFVVVTEVAKEAAKGGAKIQLRFLPPYRGHLIDTGEANGKENINVRLRELGETLAKEIAAINSSYPLGPYGHEQG